MRLFLVVACMLAIECNTLDAKAAAMGPHTQIYLHWLLEAACFSFVLLMVAVGAAGMVAVLSGLHTLWSRPHGKKTQK